MVDEYYGKISDALGITEELYDKINKQIQHLKIDATDMADLIGQVGKMWLPESVAAGILLCKLIEDNELSIKVKGLNHDDLKRFKDVLKGRFDYSEF